jgi:hypothetical protein
MAAACGASKDVLQVAEWGPDGRVVDEFRSAWGFPIETPVKATCSDAGRECQ